MTSVSAPNSTRAQHVSRVSTWRTLLADNETLSARFRGRYAIVLSQLEASATPRSIEAARKLVATDPHLAGTLLAGGGEPRQPRQTVAPPTVEGDQAIAGALSRLLVDCLDIDEFMATQPPLLQTAVPIHPSRRARSIRTDGGPVRDLVALVWPASSVEERLRNASRVAAILPTSPAAGGLKLSVMNRVALVRSDGAVDPWVFSPNLGETLEDLLRSRTASDAIRRQVLIALQELRRAMLDAGVIWQGFAPRNMFLQGNELLLIDFEEVVDTTANPARAAECLMWHQVFFADSLTIDEAYELFAMDARAPAIADGYLMPADPFERALLSVDSVTWRQRRELLSETIRIEGRHRRPENTRGDDIIYGHELGHFWGDFLPVAQETRIFAHLRPLESPITLAACLEVFEAAMEADICRAIRTDCSGVGDNSPLRTEALIDVMEAAGVDALSAARGAVDDWPVRVTTDPARLVDDLLIGLGTAVGGVDRPFLDTHLIGGADARQGHEDDLAETMRVGLDFLHGAEPEQPFLRHVEPSELRKSVARPLPVEGAAFKEVLAEVDDVIVRHSIGQGHHRYLAFPDSGNALAALAGNLLSPLLNQNLIAVDRSAPSATFVEIQVVEWLRELVGYESAPLTELRGVKDVSGLWTTGGHLSNHIAMLAALGQSFPAARRHGLRALDTQPAVVMAGPIAHYSHSDAAYHLGLGWDSVLSVDAEPGFTTDPEAVDRLLADPPAGRTPFMVIGVAGNCRTTSLDDLEALGEVCRQHGVWFHVDACHGGSLIFNSRLRARHLRGIERADSVSLDPHKGLFTPYPSSYVVFRDRGVLTQFSRHEKAVMDDDCWDLGLITPFLGSRGFESLSTWMLLHHVGAQGLGAMVEARQALVRYLERRLDEAGLFVRLNDVDFYRTAFVFSPPAVRNAMRRLDAAGRQRAARMVSAYTSRVNTSLYQSGEVCFDEHTLADLDDRVGAGAGVGYTIMAACPGNSLLTQGDLDAAVDRLVAEARPLAEDLLAEIREDTPLHQPRRLSGPAGWNDAE